MLFTTNIDNTLIFSDNVIGDTNIETLKCVENSDKRVSYISKSTLKRLKALANKIEIIPATHRSIKQFKQVEIFKKCNYAIVSNGGIILYRGNVLEPYIKCIKDIQIKYCSEFRELIKILTVVPYLDSDIQIIDEIYIFCKIKEPKRLIKILNGIIDKTLWYFYISDLNLYIYPKIITKGFALNFLKLYLIEDIVIASGASVLDESLLDISTYAIANLDSDISKDKSYLYLKNNIQTSHKLIDLIEMIYLKLKITKDINSE